MAERAERMVDFSLEELETTFKFLSGSPTEEQIEEASQILESGRPLFFEGEDEERKDHRQQPRVPSGSPEGGEFGPEGGVFIPGSGEESGGSWLKPGEFGPSLPPKVETEPPAAPSGSLAAPPKSPDVGDDRRISFKEKDYPKQAKRAENRMAVACWNDKRLGKVVEEYADDSYPMNGALRKGKKLEGKFGEKVKMLDEITASKIDPSVTVYRAVGPKGLAAVEAAMKQGRAFRDPAFVSTAANAPVATKFFGSVPTLMQITAKRGAFISETQGYPAPAMHEVVLPRNAAMRVVGMDKGVRVGKNVYNVVRLEME